MCGLALSAGGSARAATYYVDPATGSMANPGTSTSPWSTLEAVFTANKTFAAGDIIALRTGYHGFAQVKGNNTGLVTIQPDTGATPTLSRLKVDNAAQWLITNLDICPQNAPGAPYAPAITQVSVASTCSYITVQNCLVRSAFSIAGWTQADFTSRLAIGGSKSGGMVTGAPHTTFRGNTIQNTGNGLMVVKGADNSLVSRNTVQAIDGDGMRGLSDDTLFEYNTIRDSYNITSNHNDLFQSYSTGINPITGKSTTGWSTVKNVTLRGNTLISRTDANQPFPSVACQGIGMFDGMYEGWVIENNFIAVDYTNWGIALFGGINCKVVNNTVLKNLIGNPTDSGKPAIQIKAHKAYDDDNNVNTPDVPWPVLPSGNLVRNNITQFVYFDNASYGVQDHNISILPAAYPTYFTNAAALDFTLLPTSPAVGAGDPTDAPTIDIDELTRSLPYDVGAFEYFPETPVYEGFDYAATSNLGTSPGSPSDIGLVGTTWSGANQIITPGLTYPGMTTIGNALRFNSNVGEYRTIDTAAFEAAHPGFTQVDSDSVRRLGKVGTTLWVRFLIRADVADASGSAALSLNGAASGGITKLSIGDLSSSSNWSVSGGGGSASSGAPTTVGATTLLVVKIEFIAGSNNDIVSLYVNPALGATPPGAASVTLTGRNIGTFDTLMVKGTRQATIDEISIATDWSSL